MCRFCPPDPDAWVLPPLHVAPCNCRLHRDDLTTDYAWVEGAVGHVRVDVATGEIVQRVVPMRRNGGDTANGHVVDWLLAESRAVHGRPDVTLPVPF